MLRYLRTLAFLSLGGVVMFMAGCSDDETTTEPIPTGNPNDPEFVETFNMVDFSTDLIGDQLFSAVEVAFEISAIAPSAPLTRPERVTGIAAAADSFSFSYSPTSGWWSYYLEMSDSIEGYTVVYSDSLQFRDDDDDPIQWPDSTLRELRSVQSIDLTWSNDDTTASAQGGHTMVIAGDIIGEGVITIMGGGSLSGMFDGPVEDGFTCSNEVTQSYTVTGLTIDLDDSGCPEAGVLAFSGSYDIDCTDGSTTVMADDSWTFTVTFTGTQVVIAASNGSATYTVTDDDCD